MRRDHRFSLEEMGGGCVAGAQVEVEVVVLSVLACSRGAAAAAFDVPMCSCLTVWTTCVLFVRSCYV